MRQYNIDSINSGKALFFALEETGEERYRKAIEFATCSGFREHPRCQCGNFWHKQLYPNQIWLDGLYMAQPFYMAYEAKFDGMAHVADITRQFQNVRKYLYNPEKGLNYHAYDEARVQFWADKETGCSKNFWLRSTGWYLMALVDCIALCSEQLYEHYRALVDIFRESIRGVLPYRAEDGLFYQVIDHPEAEGNYTETSGSAMIAYSLLKGVRIGVLDAEKSVDCAGCVREAGSKQAACEGGRHRPPDRYLLGGRALARTRIRSVTARWRTICPCQKRPTTARESGRSSWRTANTCGRSRRKERKNGNQQAVCAGAQCYGADCGWRSVPYEGSLSAVFERTGGGYGGHGCDVAV